MTAWCIALLAIVTPQDEKGSVQDKVVHKSVAKMETLRSRFSRDMLVMAS